MYEFIEEKMGRTLSPFEYITIDEWTKQYSEEEIKHAFEIANVNNARTLNYAKTVLFSKKPQIVPSWFNKDIKSEKMTKQEEQEFEDLLKEFKQ